MKRHCWAMVVAILAAPAACDRAPGRARQGPVGETASTVDLEAFREGFTVVDSLGLEERPDAPLVPSLLFMDPAGGFLVVASGADQVRVFSSRGELLEVIGRGTGTADSLRGPTGADRLPNGDLVITTLFGQLVRVPADSTHPVQVMDTRLRPVYGVVVLGQDRVLISGSNAPVPTTLLHVWDLTRGKVVRSFFPPPAHLDPHLANALAHVTLARRGDRVAAMHELSDTMYYFDLSGNLLSRTAVPVEGFAAPSGPLPNIASDSGRLEWIGRLTFLVRQFWLNDGNLIVETSTGTGEQQIVYGLAQMDTSGRQVWTEEGTPRLLGVRNQQYFFQAQGSSTAPKNRLLVAVRSAHAESESPQPPPERRNP